MTAPIVRAISRRSHDLLNVEPVQPTDLIDLSGDEIGGSTPDAVRASAIKVLEQHLGDHYTRRPGILPLCKAVVDYLAASDIAVDAENGIVITGSMREARFIALRAMAADRTIYLPRWSLSSHYTFPALFANAKTQLLDAAGELPKAQRGVLVLPNPNPATGQLVAVDAMERLAAWVTSTDLTVIADETIAPLLRPEFSFTHFAALPGMADRTLTLGSFAGIPGLESWLVSWIAGPKSLAAHARGLKLAITLCSSAVSQYAALAGISSGSERVDAKNLERVAALLARSEIPFIEPHTIAYIVADVSKLGGGDTVASECARHGIRVMSGNNFGNPGCIRITATNEHFDDALDRLEAALISLKA